MENAARNALKIYIGEKLGIPMIEPPFDESIPELVTIHDMWLEGQETVENVMKKFDAYVIEMIKNYKK